MIWGKLYPTKYGQGHLLKELCEYSGGLFLINTGKDLSDHYYRQFLADKTHWNVVSISILLLVPKKYDCLLSNTRKAKYDLLNSLHSTIYVYHFKHRILLNTIKVH